MRRIAQSLAMAGAILGMGLSALPAGASTLGASRVTGPARAAQASPAPAQRQAAARAARLAALRNQRGIITGIVRSSSGAPEAGVCVVASSALVTRKVFTRPDGRYLIAGLPRGAYRVEYRGCSPIGRFTGQWYGGLTRTSAAKVMVTGAAPAELAPVTLGIISPRFDRAPTPRRPSPASQAAALVSRLVSGPAVQAPAQAGKVAHISGRVTNRAGHPVAKVCVLATTTGGIGFGFLARTSSTGRYRLRVRPGRYDVSFQPSCAGQGNYAPQLWKRAGSLAKATALRVKAGQVVTKIDAVLGVGAVITGRVRTNSNPHPSLGGLCVDAEGTGGQRPFFGFAVTRADGSFRLPSLATGKYRLFFNSGCGSPSPYLPAAVRTPVAVTDGKTTTGVTAVLTLGGTITGTVKDSNGKQLAGICANAGSTRNFYEAITQSNGTYKIIGVAAGSYQMQFSPGCGNKGPYAPVTLPSPVTVASGKVTPNVNAILPFDGSLTGIVKNSHGQPLGGICVVAQSSNFGFAFARTAADGTYTAKKVPPGSYQVQFIPGGVFSNCGNKGNYLPATQSVTVSSQTTSTADAVLPTGGVIKGVVNDPHGKPLAGVCVFSNSPFGGLSVTRSDGSYQLRQLFTGSYFVGFQGGCGNQQSVAPQAYRGDPTFFGPATISVTAGQVTTGVNAGLKPGATIQGHITDQTGNPVSAVCVLVVGVTGAGGFGNFGAFEIDHGGRYSAANLPPGQYNVLFSGLFARHRGCGPSPYADQQFSGVGFGARPDLVSAAGGKITTGVSAALSLAGKFSGVVSDKAGRAIANICVTATDPRTGTTAQGVSGRHGTYKVTGLPAGRYQVEFSGCGGGFIFVGETSPNYANQWYKDHSTKAGADTVVVRAGHITPNIDAAMTPGGTISGQVVYKPSQRPVSFVCVVAYTPNLGSVSAALTGRRGRYAIDGLSTGQYIVEFDPCVGESALAGQIRAGRVHVVAGQGVRGVDEQLRLGGSVSGATSVILPGGSKPAPGTCVEVLPLSQTATGSIAFSFQGGSYTATNLASGRYEVLAGDPSCSSDAPSLSARVSGQIQVAAGKTTTGVNIGLHVTGAITGVVRGPGGKPVAGICAEAVPLVGGLGVGGLGVPVGVTAAVGGGYRIGDLQPGPYKVRFTVGCGATGYATRWYKNARTSRAATVVKVSAATVTTGIDATLPRG
ncbi:MAG TPA: carboxypeptidase-like regulatory domain-containing protein [Streptosporangiaceae bacterium]|nr:carboxypeptidase-like regulatory domain-containing protein [Streptosporangiaceae bacterium]